MAMASSGIQRQDIQEAIAKAAELRALHAALVNGCSSGSPSGAAGGLRLLAGASPSLSRPSHQFTADDYPVFTPRYDEDHFRGQCFTPSYRKKVPDSSSESSLMKDGKDDEVLIIPENGNTSCHPSLSGMHTCSANEYRSSGGSLLLDVPFRRTNSQESKMKTSCGRCKTSLVSSDISCDHQKSRNANNVIPSIETQSPYASHTKNKAPLFSWIFHKVKKKAKSDMSPNTMASENMSQLLKDWGIFSHESLKKELIEANEKKDAALTEVAEMKSSLGELQEKLMGLENYCEELKKSLKQAMRGKDSQFFERNNLSKKSKSITTTEESSLPVTHEVMVEGFLQIVSEGRLSVKQFCKTLINQLEETDDDLMIKLNSLIQPHQITFGTKYSRGVLYHLEAFINQCLFQNFENCVFQKNGSPKVLDPHEDRLQNFSDFVSLRNLSWNEVLKKGTKYHSEDFSRFCDQKMSSLVSILNWSRAWPEQLLQSFFVTAKCIWLIHLLAFSFSPPLVILRVDENRAFDSTYMEDILGERQCGQPQARVKIMVMPGFYVQDRVLRCKVLCRYRTLP